MITYRMETQPPAPTASSRLFMYVAVACIVVALGVVGLVVVLTKRSLEITIIGKKDTKTVNVPIKITADNTDGVTGTVTSTVFRYAQQFYPTGTKTVDMPATGFVIIYNKTATPLSLVKTTRLITAGGDLFRLSDKVTVPAGGQATAAVYADKPGKAGEIGPSHFTVPGLPADVQSTVYADSSEVMTGGVRSSAVLSQKDIDDAKKAYKDKVLSVYLAGASSTLPAESQQVAMVYKSNPVVDKKAGDEVTSFTITSDNTLVSITYQKDQVLSLIQKELRGKIDVTSEKIVSGAKDPEVQLASYNPADGTANLNVVQQVTVTIDPNADKLAPANFFEKSKEEIERYILSLDHVGQVDVKFSPSWINSAPKDPDKIRVVVKDI